MVVKFEDRFGAALPKVGIRPTIDGRRGGVRESLEGVTMEMARVAARLISENLRHPNGAPVECVIADTTIGGVAEAAACAEKFRKENVTVTLTVTPCWCYGAETMDMDPHTIKGVWGFNGSDRPGAVYLAAVLAAHNQKGLPAFGIYGRDVQDFDDVARIPEDVAEKLLRFVRAGIAVSWMRNKSYLSIGSVSMGIAGSIVDPHFFESYLGMRVEYVDMSELVRRLELGIYDHKEFEQAYSWVREKCKEGPDNNPPELQHSREKKDEVWATSVKMAMIVRDLMVGNPVLRESGWEEESLGHHAILAGFQGQRQWTDYFPNGDFLEAILNSSFDWNGIREPYLVATENDSLNGVAMLFGHLLTGTAQLFSDVRTYWSPAAIERVTGWVPEGEAANGLIHLINSGPTCLDATGKQRTNGRPVIKPFWEVTEDEVHACLDATLWRYANLGYFRGGGYSTDFLTEGGMPVTMSRVNLVKGVGPVLQIAEGYTVDVPQHVHDVLDERTDPTWPTTWFVPRLTGKEAFTDVYSVMAHWGANHGAISYGHIGADLITLASMLRIPVCMHNVPEELIFRPTYWYACGQDPEGADYRACATLGPLYGSYRR
ncbi:L-fucose isomerase [Spirochaeta thermophila DSM 6578]|uniref:L-fucose isomerase n=1 Tax=Winmispira thermophila (strain ATCC 700085 / DSM 6578 / Z-1203) TaxID=869211 RepID=G0GEM3_WINT7|nr:L-fucose isomerase [Spirochaeta thermophila]AEJ60711.1 L-fucose isomerase [Spirochaeta thermophila DSM 6578]